MKKNRKIKGKYIVLLILLGALCIGGVELAAFSIFAPEHYEEMVSPVRDAARSAADTAGSFVQEQFDRVQEVGARLVDGAAHLAQAAQEKLHQGAEALSQFWEELTRPPEEIPAADDAQAASEPEIPTRVAADPLLTELKIVDGQEVLTGGNVNMIFYNQGQEPWASQPYGTDNIGKYGCGPTAMAMIVSSLTSEQINPADMAQWAVDHGYWASQHGSYLSIVEGTAHAFGLEAEAFSGFTSEELVAELLNGRVLVALVGPGHFTKGGHFIVLRGATLGGKVLISDPNSTQRSLLSWDPQIILDELSSSTSDGAPLWSIWLEEP